MKKRHIFVIIIMVTYVMVIMAIVNSYRIMKDREPTTYNPQLEQVEHIYNIQPATNAYTFRSYEEL